ncbi:MAG: endonuclease/exonuclease/phosphatase family protein [Pseudomonadales bacterium]|nr:endonuclease/exonuclease/phosphatase family protein [Pseudomonadales bacterium]
MLRHFSTNLKRSANRSPATLVSFDDTQKNGPPKTHRTSLKLLSYNIQIGIQSQAYRHYVTRGWQHVLPHSQRSENLDRIASTLSHFDIVALQEADGGSIRTGHINQVRYLAEAAGFPYWYQQLNRNLGKLAQHSNGVLSQLKPQVIEDHKLPGLLPGRGAIVLRYGSLQVPLVLVILHLSLGQRARNNQLSYIKELIKDYRHVVVMGDLNSNASAILKQLSPLSERGLTSPSGVFNTYPSWKPIHNYDQILVSSSLTIKHVEVLDRTLSDHLPIAMEIELPDVPGFVCAS